MATKKNPAPSEDECEMSEENKRLRQRLDELAEVFVGFSVGIDGERCAQEAADLLARWGYLKVTDSYYRTKEN